MTPRPPELVEMVAAQMRLALALAAWRNVTDCLACYALALAERAAREAQCQGCTEAPSEAVRRAVADEGGGA